MRTPGEIDYDAIITSMSIYLQRRTGKGNTIQLSNTDSMDNPRRSKYQIYYSNISGSFLKDQLFQNVEGYTAGKLFGSEDKTGLMDIIIGAKESLKRMIPDSIKIKDSLKTGIDVGSDEVFRVISEVFYK